MDLAPIVLFTYNRPIHTRKTLESLMENELSGKSQLFIYVDGPKPNASEEVLNKIAEVKKVIREKKWCQQVTITEFQTNRTLPVTLVEKITEITSQYDKIIVLEDDHILSKGFLTYMNEGLELYRNKPPVMMISGYMFPIRIHLPETFFLKGHLGWGWGTWKRAWSLFNPSPEELLKEVEQKGIHAFNLDGSSDYYGLLKKCAEGSWKYWDIRWEASIYVNNGLCLCPRLSLIRNIGHDGSGVNCGSNLNYQNQIISEKIKVIPQKIKENKQARNALSRHLRSLTNTLTPIDRIKYHYFSLLSKITEGRKII